MNYLIDFQEFKRVQFLRFSYEPIEKQTGLLWEVSLSRRFSKSQLRNICRHYRIKFKASDNKYNLYEKLLQEVNF